MIERWIKNELSLRNWRYFKSQKLAVLASWILFICTILSLTAEIWSNSRPIILYKAGEFYFPTFVDYHPTTFGREDIYVMDYRALELSDSDWALWPPNRWDPFESNKAVNSYPSPPSLENWLGTDDRGRDLLARLLYGFRYSISFSILVWFFSMLLGIAIGAVMGFFGGKIDLFGQRLVELWESFPYLLLLLVLIATFSPTLVLLALFNTAFGWMLFSAYMRAEFLKLRRQSFVEAAVALGAHRTRIIFRHILPNALGPVVALSPFVISSNITLLASLDYLGLGLMPPTPSWGELFSQAKNYPTIGWWIALFTSIAIFSTLVLLNLIGEAVRDTFDPRRT